MKRALLASFHLFTNAGDQPRENDFNRFAVAGGKFKKLFRLKFGRGMASHDRFVDLSAGLVKTAVDFVTKPGSKISSGKLPQLPDPIDAQLLQCFNRRIV